MSSTTHTTRNTLPQDLLIRSNVTKPKPRDNSIFVQHQRQDGRPRLSAQHHMSLFPVHYFPPAHTAHAVPLPKAKSTRIKNPTIKRSLLVVTTALPSPPPSPPTPLTKTKTIRLLSPFVPKRPWPARCTYGVCSARVEVRVGEEYGNKLCKMHAAELRTCVRDMVQDWGWREGLDKMGSFEGSVEGSVERSVEEVRVRRRVGGMWRLEG
jgi:hypothetical protein